LGALLGLGLNREVFGDIVLSERQDRCQVLIDSGVLEFVLANLRQVGKCPVTVKETVPRDIPPRTDRVKEIRATVASLRLDSVAAAGFGVSRTKMTAEIEAEKVKLNWQNAKSSAQTVKQGDIISALGRGRVEVSQIIGQTKKGRTSIVLKRYI